MSCMPTSCKVTSDVNSLTVLHDYDELDRYRFAGAASHSPEKVLRGWATDLTATFVDIFVCVHRPDHVLFTTDYHGALDGKSYFSYKATTAFQRYVSAWKEKYNINTKLIFRSTLATNHDSSITSYQHLFDTEAMELGRRDVWDYWDVTSTIIEPLYWAYHRLETPYVYFADKSVISRGLFIDRHHFTYWIYSELNKAMIIKYFL